MDAIFLRKNSQTLIVNAQVLRALEAKEVYVEQTFSEAEARQWLAEHLPTWRVRNGYLMRVYRTGSWRLTLMVANAIGFVAEAADHHPELLLNYPSVEVHLETHSAGGITQKDYELAQQIEETVTWYPAEGLALAGTKKEQWIQARND